MYVCKYKCNLYFSNYNTSCQIEKFGLNYSSEMTVAIECVIIFNIENINLSVTKSKNIISYMWVHIE